MGFGHGNSGNERDFWRGFEVGGRSEAIVRDFVFYFFSSLVSLLQCDGLKWWMKYKQRVSRGCIFATWHPQVCF